MADVVTIYSSSSEAESSDDEATINMQKKNNDLGIKRLRASQSQSQSQQSSGNSNGSKNNSEKMKGTNKSKKKKQIIDSSSSSESELNVSFKSTESSQSLTSTNHIDKDGDNLDLDVDVDVVGEGNGEDFEETNTSVPVRQLNDECLRAIFSKLSREDQLNCSLVCKSFLQIIRGLISVGRLTIDYKLTRKFSNASKKKYRNKREETPESGPKDLQQLIENYYPHATTLIIDYGVCVPAKYFNSSFFLRQTLKHLIICGSMKWLDCRCKSVAGIYTSIDPEELHGQLEKLDTIEVASTVLMNACCLLDLVCRAPKLRVIKFHGRLMNEEHFENFISSNFPGKLKTLQWPIVKFGSDKVVELIIEKNEYLENVDCTSIIVCSMLSQKRLFHMKRLVIELSEVWEVTSRNDLFITNIKYLDLAKKLESLEIRSYNFEEQIDLETVDGREIDRCRLEREKYMKSFWGTIEKISSIKALTIYGCWDFNLVCHQVSNHAKNVQFLKINLLPDAIREIKEDRDIDSVRELNIEDGLINLSSLLDLRSLHIIISEKLHDITLASCEKMTKLADKLWILDAKVPLTSNIQELIFNIQRRGNPLNRTYRLSLLVSPKDSELRLGEIIVEPNIGAEGTRYKSIEHLESNLHKLAQNEIQERLIEATVGGIAVWGLALAPAFKCKQYYHLKSEWDYYFEHFAYDRHFQM